MDDACSSTSMNNARHEHTVAQSLSNKRLKPSSDDINHQYRQINPSPSTQNTENFNASNIPLVQIQNSKAEMFFKTKLCTKFMHGSCPFRANCTFAHGQSELRLPPPNWQEEVSIQCGEYRQRLLHKYKICKTFAALGRCLFGPTCGYIHERPHASSSGVVDVGPKVRDKTGGDCVVVLAGGFGRNTVGNYQQMMTTNLRPELWKTKMCHKWEITGFCPFGDNCNFAHRVEDLKKYGGNRAAVGGNAQMASASAVPATSDNKEVMNQLMAQDCKTKDQQPKVAGFPKLLNKWGYEIRKTSGIYGDWINDES